MPLVGVGGSSPFHKNLYEASPRHSQYQHTAHSISKQNAIALPMRPPETLKPCFLPAYPQTPPG